MANIQFFLLGTPRLEVDGCLVKLSRRKVMALLSYLVVSGQPHTRRALATLLWPESEPSKALAALRRILSIANTQIGTAVLKADRTYVTIAPDAPLTVDLLEFRRSLSSASVTQISVSERGELLDRAVKLYRGDFMAGFVLGDVPEFDDWQFAQGEKLRLKLADALHHLVQLHRQQGEMEQAIDYARRWVDLDPLQELAQQTLYQLYQFAGRTAMAVYQRHHYARRMERELGVGPNGTVLEPWDEQIEGINSDLRLDESPDWEAITPNDRKIVQQLAIFPESFSSINAMGITGMDLVQI